MARGFNSTQRHRQQRQHYHSTRPGTCPLETTNGAVSAVRGHAVQEVAPSQHSRTCGIHMARSARPFSVHTPITRQQHTHAACTMSPSPTDARSSSSRARLYTHPSFAQVVWQFGLQISVNPAAGMKSMELVVCSWGRQSFCCPCCLGVLC
jgi:hypothetical protein